MKKKVLKKKGFTLVEIMVAVSIFTIVALIVTSTLLIIMDASRRANKIRLVIDNINFALDSMTVKMKFGTGYEIGGNGSSVSFIDRDQNEVCYKKVNSSSGGSIQKCDSGCSNVCNNITSEEINVTNLKFQEGICDDDSNCLNDLIVIAVSAEATIKNQPTLKLDFQTAVSQAQSF